MCISLPHCRDAFICAHDLARYFDENSIGELMIGTRHVTFDNHPLERSLDRWLRSRLKPSCRDTAQATVEVVEALCATGLFRRCETKNSDTDRSVRAIARTERSVPISLYRQPDRPAHSFSPILPPASFVEETARNLKETYLQAGEDRDKRFVWAWRMSEPVADLLDGFEPGDMQGAEDARRVKRAARTWLSAAPPLRDRRTLLTWFVRDFGGVRTGDEALPVAIAYAEELSQQGTAAAATQVPLERISTISKCLTLLDAELPIYDSRVGFSLNAINWLAGTLGRYLPCPIGRNASLDLIDLRTLHLMARPENAAGASAALGTGHRSRARHALATFTLPEEATYRIYRETLAHASELLHGDGEVVSIDDLEMFLFASAEPYLVQEVLNASLPVEDRLHVA